MPLYPTRFRWNILQPKRHWLAVLHFISHTVQMKPSSFTEGFTNKTSFISHTVQMKLTETERYTLIAIALYPTRFRWNKSFIYEFGKNFYTLYPTRFRWNELCWRSLSKHLLSFISHTVQMKQDNKVIVLLDAQTSFISHTVQMKPEITTPKII